MPFYEYCCEDCDFTVEEMLSMDERDRPVGTPCPDCGGKIYRAIGANVQDVTYTDKERLSKGIRKPQGQFRERMQQITELGSQGMGYRQKKALKDRFNL